MSVEQYANNAYSTLAAAVDNSQTTLGVIDATPFPTVPQFRLKVDDELMLCTALAGATFTVERGIENTTPAEHMAGTQIYLPLTSASLLNLPFTHGPNGAPTLNQLVKTAEASTLAPLPTCIYSNGIAGIGATLAATANGTLVLDGYTPLIAAGILVKDQADARQNGIYTLTQAGDLTHPWILTRTIGEDIPQAYRDLVVFVIYGNVLGGTTWACVAYDPILGTDDLAWVQSAHVISSIGVNDEVPGIGGPVLFDEGTDVTVSRLAQVVTIELAACTRESTLYGVFASLCDRLTYIENILFGTPGSPDVSLDFSRSVNSQYVPLVT